MRCSIAETIGSCSRVRKVPELVRTLHCSSQAAACGRRSRLSEPLTCSARWPRSRCPPANRWLSQGCMQQRGLPLTRTTELFSIEGLACDRQTRIN